MTSLTPNRKGAGEGWGDSRQAQPHGLHPRRPQTARGACAADFRLLLVSPKARALSARTNVRLPQSQCHGAIVR